jgi:YspA, cpYpsA-related SLOG family
MKVIVAGSRTIHELDVVKKAIEDSGFQVDEVVSAMAPGVDRLGEEYAEENGIPVQQFPANTRVYGLVAWIKVNEAMARYADALVAVHNGSKGTKHMIKKMREAGKPVHEVLVLPEPAV